MLHLSTPQLGLGLGLCLIISQCIVLHLSTPQLGLGLGLCLITSHCIVLHLSTPTVEKDKRELQNREQNGLD